MLELRGRYLIIWKKIDYIRLICCWRILLDHSVKEFQEKRVEIENCEVVDLLKKISAGEEGIKDTKVAI